MNEVIGTIGQAALVLAGVVVLLALAYAACWMVALIIRTVRRLVELDDRPSSYRSGIRKW